MAKVAQENTLKEVLNAVKTKNYKQKIDVDGTTTYVGYAKIGSADDGGYWQIKKVVETSPDAEITWANGNDKFNKVWTRRTEYTYS